MRLNTAKRLGRTLRLSLCLTILLGMKTILLAYGVKDLLPTPKQVTEQKGSYSPHGLRIEADCLQEELQAYLQEQGIRLGTSYRQAIKVRLVDTLEEAETSSREAYTLAITSEGIEIRAITEQGAFWALQTLRQLSEPHRPLPLVRIVDYPSWRIRGYMHDIGRTFIPFEELKEQIAQLSRFKINFFHWHLTEHQAWRLESKAYPELTSISATERMPGDYYTLEQARELAQWCRKHRMTLLPEIDMPGHSAAFERALGFGMQSSQGKAALKTILREAIEAMDVPYIHLGTDEVEFTDPTFVSEMVSYVRSLGRKAASWHPGFPYKPGEVDLIQMWSYKGRPLAGTPSIDSRLHYLNHYDTFADLIALHQSQIAGLSQETEEYAGSIVAVWNDRFVSPSRAIVAQNNFYPCVLALADRAWRGGGRGYFDQNSTVARSRKDALYSDFSDFERRLLYYKGTWLQGEAIPYVGQMHAVWHISEAMPNGGDLSKSFPPEKSLAGEAKGGQITPPSRPISYEYEGNRYASHQVYGSGFYLRHVWGEQTQAGVFAHPQPNHTAYAQAWIYSPKRQTVGLMLETQNYSRSEKDLPPPQGQWDYKQSRVWLNGSAIHPPRWSAQHTEKSNEILLGNENMTARPPIAVTLRQGWNHVLIKLPIGQWTSEEVRLVKWMFAASFTSLDGKEALPLRYWEIPSNHKR